MSSATTVRCPHCSAKLRIKSRRLDGKELSCPNCTQTILLERGAGTSDYVAVLFFRGHDDRWATKSQPTNRETIAATPENTVSYERSSRDRRWRWPVASRTSAVVLSLGLVFCVMLGGYSVVGNEYRVWQTADGRRSKIKLACVAHDGRTVRFKRQDNGPEIRLPLANLSREDREHLAQHDTRDTDDAAVRVESGSDGLVARTRTNNPNTNPVDWPMWRGSSRDGVVSAGPTLLTRSAKNAC
jgi:predicted Zn finger-like uncharacterized protein